MKYLTNEGMRKKDYRIKQELSLTLYRAHVIELLENV